jgi:hypothetical protein
MLEIGIDRTSAKLWILSRGFRHIGLIPPETMGELAQVINITCDLTNSTPFCSTDAGICSYFAANAAALA